MMSKQFTKTGTWLQAAFVLSDGETNTHVMVDCLLDGSTLSPLFLILLLLPSVLPSEVTSVEMTRLLTDFLDALLLVGGGYSCTSQESAFIKHKVTPSYTC